MNEFFILGIALFVFMNLLFVVSIFRKRNDVADVGWGMGFALLSWLAFFVFGSFGLHALVVSLLATVWGIRLAVHIFLRNKGRKEDYRYQKWRDEWGKYFYLRSYFQVYILQGALLFVIALPLIFAAKQSISGLGILGAVGVFVWLAGFVFEAVGDWQLARFARDPENKGRLLQSGLWKYTRHPNYFGEVALWWGIFLISLEGSGVWLGILGPLTITFLILKVSGIPLLEEKMKNNPEFRRYQKTTNKFFPWFPRES